MGCALKLQSLQIRSSSNFPFAFFEAGWEQLSHLGSKESFKYCIPRSDGSKKSGPKFFLNFFLLLTGLPLWQDSCCWCCCCWCLCSDCCFLYWSSFICFILFSLTLSCCFCCTWSAFNCFSCFFSMILVACFFVWAKYLPAADISAEAERMLLLAVEVLASKWPDFIADALLLDTDWDWSIFTGCFPGTATVWRGVERTWASMTPAVDVPAKEGSIGCIIGYFLLLGGLPLFDHPFLWPKQVLVPGPPAART